MENSIKMDDLGVSPISGNLHMHKTHVQVGGHVPSIAENIWLVKRHSSELGAISQLRRWEFKMSKFLCGIPPIHKHSPRLEVGPLTF